MNSTYTQAFLKFVCTLFIAIPCSTKIAYASAGGYTAHATVGEACTINFAIAKPPGLYTIVFHGRPYIMADVTPDSDIDLNGIIMVGKLVQYLAEPAYNRPSLAVTQIIEGETVLTPIHYNDEELSGELNRCFKTDAYSPPPKAKQSDSKYALVPDLVQLRDQALALNLNIADYYNCQCGQAFSTVQMHTPPWLNESLILETGGDACVLRSDQPDANEFLRAGGTSDADETNCAVSVGLHTRHMRSKLQPELFPKYNTAIQQACYNIITAKAQQWLNQGGKLQVLETGTGAKTPATSANIMCRAQ